MTLGLYFFSLLQLVLLREQFGEREPQMEEREEGKFVDSSSGNSVTNDQELSADTSARQEGKSSVHNQKINTDASPTPPPPPPPPPALKPPTSQIRRILSNPVWMMKEIVTE